jgi:DNA-binding transcriptional MocR family regulator
MVLSGPPGERQRAFERLELIADTYLSVSSPVQHALPRLLELGSHVRDDIQQRVRANLRHLRSALAADSPAQLLNTEGGWYATLEVPRTRSEEQWALDLLGQDNLIVQPGYFYDFEREAFLVLSLLTPPQSFATGLARILAQVST